MTIKLGIVILYTDNKTLQNNNNTCIGGFIMDKEEILKKSREQKEDEGIVFADNKGRRYGEIGFCSIFIIIMLFNFFNKQNNFIPFSMFWAYISAETFGKYRITKKKALMVTTVFAAIASVAFLICHMLAVLRIGA